MRDLVLISILPLLIYYGFKRPFIGSGLWLWTSAFNINNLVYGVATSITYNRLFAIVTIIGFLYSKNKPKFSLDKISLLILFFFIWATASSFLSDADQETVWMKWNEFLKIIMFYLFAIAILQGKRHLEFMMWVLVLSIGALAGGEGVKFIVSGGAHRTGGISGITGDNNFFAVMILVMLPMTVYLISQTKSLIVKNGLIALTIFIVFGLISTYSRSGFIGLAVFTLFALSSSKRKVLWILLLSITIYSAMELLPEEWFNRMDTVETAEEDNSFMHRVVVWKMCTIIALDNPFFGEGFRSIENLLVWQRYVPNYHLLDFIVTPDVNYFEPVRAAHSIYFQVLSDHGFVGLFVFMLIIFSTYVKIGTIKKRAKKNNMDNWVFTLLSMLRISIIVYCVSGGSVGIAYFDFLYAIFAMVYVLDNRIVINEITNGESFVENKH